MMASTTLSNSEGFTLLEVIVALGITSISILGVSSALSGHINSFSEVEKRTIAYWVAENRLQTLRIIDTIPSVGEVSGIEEMAGNLWYYKQLTEKTSDPLLYRVTISVYTDKNDEHKTASLFGYLLK